MVKAGFNEKKFAVSGYDVFKEILSVYKLKIFHDTDT